MATSWMLSLVALKTKQNKIIVIIIIIIKACYFLELELTFMSLVSQLHKMQDEAAKLTTVIGKCNPQRFGPIQRMDVDCFPEKLSHWNQAHGKERPGRPKTSRRKVIQKDTSIMDLEWAAEEAEVAARECLMCRHL